jgi:hypothetical protein
MSRTECRWVCWSSVGSSGACDMFESTYLVKQTSHLMPASTPKPPSISASSSTCSSAGVSAWFSLSGSVTSMG